MAWLRSALVLVAGSLCLASCGDDDGGDEDNSAGAGGTESETGGKSGSQGGTTGGKSAQGGRGGSTPTETGGRVGTTGGKTGSGGNPDGGVPSTDAGQTGDAGEPTSAGAGGESPANTGGKASTGGKAGTGGAGPTGGSGPSGGSGNPDWYGETRCDSAGLGLCDDFERADLFGNGIWMTGEMDDAEVATDDTRAARGERSMHIRTASHAGGRYWLRQTEVLPGAGKSMYGRAFLYFAAPTPIVHSSILGGFGRLNGNGNEVIIRLSLNDAKLAPNYVVYGGTEYGVGNVNTRPDLPTDKWVCLEWQYAADTAELHFWLDEQELSTIAVGASTNPQWTQPVYDWFQIGLELHHEDDRVESFEAWYDEVAFDEARIGCEK